MTRVWIDGRIVPADEPQILVGDRGFQLGDAVFETLRVRHGVPIEWDEHVARLYESAAALAIGLPADAAARLRSAVGDLLAATGLADDVALRITVSRGAMDRRGVLPPGWQATEPTIVIQAFEHLPLPSLLLERGLRAIVSSIRRDGGSPLAGVKSTSRADHVFARIEAERAGADEALFLTAEGLLSEATSANLFAIHGDLLSTPPVSAAILPGTTRTWLLVNAAGSVPDLHAEERDLRLDDLAAAEEAFLTSSVAGIVPLVEIDGRRIGTGRPGSRTLALRAAREAWIDAAAGIPAR